MDADEAVWDEGGELLAHQSDLADGSVGVQGDYIVALDNIEVVGVGDGLGSAVLELVYC